VPTNAFHFREIPDFAGPVVPGGPQQGQRGGHAAL